MKLWLLINEIVTGYDTYDSAVVAAETEAAARTIHPSGNNIYWKRETYCSWCRQDEVIAQLLGTALKGTKAGIICASFNAG
jgi:hypothetical protein